MVLQCKIRQFLGKNKICEKNPIKIHVQNIKTLHPSSSTSTFVTFVLLDAPIVSAFGDIVDLPGSTSLLIVIEVTQFA